MSSEDDILESSAPDYPFGSFAERVQTLLRSSLEDTDQAIAYVFSNSAEPQVFFDGILGEFKNATAPILAADTLVDANHLLHKWNQVGGIYLHINPQLADRWFSEWYELSCKHQSLPTKRFSKGTPLHNRAVAQLSLGNRILASRLFQLAYTEDLLDDLLRGTNARRSLPAFSELSKIRGIGIADNIDEVGLRLYPEGDSMCLFPEFILLEVSLKSNEDHKLTTGEELVDPLIANQLLGRSRGRRSQDELGKALELLMGYLLSCVEGFEVLRDIKARDSQHDLLVRNLIVQDPVFAEFGKYILVECKNWTKPVGTAVLKSFIANVRFHSCHCGILVSKKGITGEGSDRANDSKNAMRTILKEYHHDNVIIIVINESDIERMIRDKTVLTVLLSKYEKVRFDLL